VSLQRDNHLTFVPRGNGCEMHALSKCSGWGHGDQGDFKKRVDESLAKVKAAPPAPPPGSSAPAQPAEPASPPK